MSVWWQQFESRVSILPPPLLLCTTVMCEIIDAAKLGDCQNLEKNNINNMHLL